MDTQPTTVLITGANRGIGKGLIEAYLARANHTVIAAVRDTSTTDPITQLPIAKDSRLVVVKLDATMESDAAAAVMELSTKHSIHHLDIVIANAGVVYIWPKVADLKIDDMMASLRPNVFGIVYLYQATRHLLNRAVRPKWITIGSTAGSIGVSWGQLKGPNAAYGPTKAAAHWLTKRINTEEALISAFVFHPGWVATDLSSLGATNVGLKQAPTSVKESVEGMVPIIDKAAKETYEGTFWEFNGNAYPW